MLKCVLLLMQSLSLSLFLSLSLSLSSLSLSSGSSRTDSVSGFVLGFRLPGRWKIFVFVDASFVDASLVVASLVVVGFCSSRSFLVIRIVLAATEKRDAVVFDAVFGDVVFVFGDVVLVFAVVGVVVDR